MTMLNNSMTRRSFTKLISCTCVVTLGAGLLGTGLASADSASDIQADTARDGIDYMALVNKQHLLPDGWEDAVEIVHFTNSEHWDVDVEAKAYEAYLALKDDLASEGIFVDLDSAYRSVEKQQRIVDEFTQKYGEEYVKLYVAVPGFSEHHTGLALDLFLIIDGKGVYYNEDMVLYPEIWQKIQAKAADYGFILRYLPCKKIFTGYSYEPWHIRYIDSPEIAHKIMDAGLTFEEYLDEVEPCVAGCVADYGDSQLYTEADMDSALDVILTQFRTWKGCVMKRFAFAGDDACNAEELTYVNALREANLQAEAFDQAIVFVTDFRSPSEEDAKGTAWEPDADYKDWTWHLGRTGSDGSWKLLTWGYA